MFTDARTLPDKTLLEADIAVIGGGPAGISLARAFKDRPVQVCIVEAGGQTFDPRGQSLYEGVSTGIDYPLAATRLRYFGGSSNHWGGYCRPLDPIDFEARDWVPHSGWPFGIEELTPYYALASELVEVDPPRFADKAYWQQETGETLPDPVTGRMQVRYVHFSPPTRFGSRYGPELAAAQNIQVLLNANVVKIAAAENGSAVTGLHIRTLDGRDHSVKARLYVLAAGGLENPRILLLSNDVVRAGLGNQNDMVGRFFLEHPHVTGFGEVLVADIDRLPGIYRDRVAVEGRSAKAAFNASEAFLRQRGLLNATIMYGVAGQYSGQDAVESDRSRSHMTMLRAARPFLTDGDPGAGPGVADPLGYWLGLGSACEQVPNPDSRVTLAEERDALGLQKLRLDWRLTEQDRRSLLEHMRSLAMEFGAQGLGRMRLHLEDDGRWPSKVAGGSHHMGTTRMHDDPKQGVVDRNCRVHGIDNLFVAGSSVFPTGGAANPTLTLLALTLRLADHLRPRLGT